MPIDPGQVTWDAPPQKAGGGVILTDPTVQADEARKAAAEARANRAEGRAEGADARARGGHHVPAGSGEIVKIAQMKES